MRKAGSLLNKARGDRTTHVPDLFAEGSPVIPSTPRLSRRGDAFLVSRSSAEPLTARARDRLDLLAALAMPGVQGILTADDLPRWGR